MKYRLFIQVFLFSSLMLISGQSALAADLPTQTHSALLVQPAILELLLEPGVTSETKIAVTNQSGTPLPVTTFVKKLEVLDENQVSNSDIFDASNWFKVVDGDFILQAGQRREVTLRVTPPATAEVGGHYATIYFEPLVPFEELAPNTAHLTTQVGSLAFLTVKGEQTVRAAVSSPLTTAKFRQYGPVNFQFKIANSGTTHILPGGAIHIYDWHNHEVDQVSILPGVVLPKTIRTFNVSWGTRNLFGKYTAKLIAAYGPDHQLLTSSVTFWVLPGLALIGLCTLAIAIIYFVFRTRGRWGRAVRILMNPQE